MAVGLYAGSFDPVHLGHMATIRAAAGQLDRLVVVVASNSQKRAGLFGVGERVTMLSKACQDLENVSVASHNGLLIDIAGRLGADLLVRGAGKEHVDEKQMAYMNSCEGLPTVLVPADPATAFISSSQVRSLLSIGAPDVIEHLVPAGVVALARPRTSR